MHFTNIHKAPLPVKERGWGVINNSRRFINKKGKKKGRRNDVPFLEFNYEMILEHHNSLSLVTGFHNVNASFEIVHSEASDIVVSLHQLANSVEDVDV